MSRTKRQRRTTPDTGAWNTSSQETEPALSSYVAPPRDFSHRIILAAAFLCGIWLCIPLLEPLPLVLDEYGTYWIMSNENPLTLMARSLNYENIPPLAPFINNIFFELLGRTEFAFRFHLALWYLLTIGAVYLLGRSLSGPFPASLAAFLCAWNQNILGETRISRCYSFGLLLATLSFWATVHWSRKPMMRRWAIAWTILNCGLIWTHYLNSMVTLAQLVVLFLSFRQGSIGVWNRVLWSLAAYGFATLPLLPPLFRMAEWGSTFGFQQAEPLYKVLTSLWWCGVPAGVAIGYLFTRPGPDSDARIVPAATMKLLIFWGLVPLLAAWLIGEFGFASLSNPRYRIGFAGPACCLAAAILAHRRTRSLAIISLAIAMFGAWVFAPRWPWDLKRLGTEQSYEWRDMALHIEKQGVADEPIYVQSGMGEGFLVPAFYLDPVFLDYAACRLGRFYCKTPHPRIGLPFLWTAGPDVVEHYIHQITDHAQSKNPTLWLAGATDTDLNRSSVRGFQELLRQAGYRETDRQENRHSVLIRYRHHIEP